MLWGSSEIDTAKVSIWLISWLASVNIVIVGVLCHPQEEIRIYRKHVCIRDAIFYFQQISSFCAKNYQNKVFWILSEGCESDEIL